MKPKMEFLAEIDRRGFTYNEGTDRLEPKPIEVHVVRVYTSHIETLTEAVTNDEFDWTDPKIRKSLAKLADLIRWNLQIHHLPKAEAE